MRLVRQPNMVITGVANSGVSSMVLHKIMQDIQKNPSGAFIFISDEMSHKDFAFNVDRLGYAGVFTKLKEGENRGELLLLDYNLAGTSLAPLYEVVEKLKETYGKNIQLYVDVPKIVRATPPPQTGVFVQKVNHAAQTRSEVYSTNADFYEAIKDIRFECLTQRKHVFRTEPKTVKPLM